MQFARAAILVLFALSTACGSDETSTATKKDGGTADTRTSADAAIATDAPSDGPVLSDLSADAVRADTPTGIDISPADLSTLPDAVAAEAAYTAEVSGEAAVSPLDAHPDFLGPVEDLALPSPDTEDSVDLAPLQPGQCRLGADCPARDKPHCARIGVCVECEWNQQCGSLTPYCVDYRCAPSPEGWLDGGIDATAG